jgi:hypothetical protein
MNRRGFVSLCAVNGAISILHSKDKIDKSLPKDIYNTIQAVQEHFFPLNITLPSASEFGATKFLNSTIFHKSFDKDIKDFVISGAEEFMIQENGKFIEYDSNKKEIALRKFENTSLGANWLSRIMILSLEALLSDPIYGGNIKQSGWDFLQTTGGNPRPINRYANG